jgi:branched-chain amino acid transport system permease protein
MISQRQPFLVKAAPWIVIAVAILILPIFVRISIATIIWIFAILAVAFNILLGYTGLLSFGQATFFGVGGYVSGLLLIHFNVSILIALIAGTLAGGLTAAFVGRVSIQRLGLYFILLTFAFNQMFYFIAYQWSSLTGGEDGLPGVPRPSLGIGDIRIVDLSGSLSYYLFTVAIFLLSMVIMKWIVASPLGKILEAIRENEARAAAVGYNVKQYKWFAFIISGGFSGLAGVLYAMLFGIVPLDTIHWLISGDIVFMALVGGIGNFYGPIIGAAVYIWLSESLSVMWARWPLMLGVAFIIVVFFFRGGCVEAGERILAFGIHKLKKRR